MVSVLESAQIAELGVAHGARTAPVPVEADLDLRSSPTGTPVRPEVAVSPAPTGAAAPGAMMPAVPHSAGSCDRAG
jgi:hypothetical protein